MAINPRLRKITCIFWIFEDYRHIQNLILHLLSQKLEGVRPFGPHATCPWNKTVNFECKSIPKLIKLRLVAISLSDVVLSNFDSSSIPLNLTLYRLRDDIILNNNFSSWEKSFDQGSMDQSRRIQSDLVQIQWSVWTSLISSVDPCLQFFLADFLSI